MENKKNNLPTVVAGVLLLISVIANINQQAEIKEIKSSLSYSESRKDALERKVKQIESEFEDCQNELEDCQSHKRQVEYDLQNEQFNNGFR